MNWECNSACTIIQSTSYALTRYIFKMILSAGPENDVEYCQCVLQLALIVAQHRDRKNILSGIKLTALSHGLQRVYKAAKHKRGNYTVSRVNVYVFSFFFEEN